MCFGLHSTVHCLKICSHGSSVARGVVTLTEVHPSLDGLLDINGAGAMNPNDFGDLLTVKSSTVGI